MSKDFRLRYAKVHYPFGKPPKDEIVYWRCDTNRYSIVHDAEREIYGVSDPQLELTWYAIKRKTPKGVRLSNDVLVLRQNFKKWAYPTIEEAVEGFIRRKVNYQNLLTARLDSVTYDLALVRYLKEKGELNARETETSFV